MCMHACPGHSALPPGCRAGPRLYLRPYLVGTGGGGLELVELDGPIAKVGGLQRAAAACSTLPLRSSEPRATVGGWGPRV